MTSSRFSEISSQMGQRRGAGVVGSACPGVPMVARPAAEGTTMPLNIRSPARRCIARLRAVLWRDTDTAHLLAWAERLGREDGLPNLPQPSASEERITARFAARANAIARFALKELDDLVRQQAKLLPRVAGVRLDAVAERAARWCDSWKVRTLTRHARALRKLDQAERVLRNQMRLCLDVEPRAALRWIGPIAIMLGLLLLIFEAAVNGFVLADVASDWGFIGAMALGLGLAAVSTLLGVSGGMLCRRLWDNEGASRVLLCVPVAIAVLGVLALYHDGVGFMRMMLLREPDTAAASIIPMMQQHYLPLGDAGAMMLSGVGLLCAVLAFVAGIEVRTVRARARLGHAFCAHRRAERARDRGVARALHALDRRFSRFDRMLEKATEDAHHALASFQLVSDRIAAIGTQLRHSLEQNDAEHAEAIHAYRREYLLVATAPRPAAWDHPPLPPSVPTDVRAAQMPIETRTAAQIEHQRGQVAARLADLHAKAAGALGCAIVDGHAVAVWRAARDEPHLPALIPSAAT
jgi:hypothetical protein